MNRRDTILIGLSALTTAIMRPVPGTAQSQYPDRPIRLIVPFAPGGVMDVVARLWADKMKPVLGTIVTENRGGASGTIGVAEVARSTPDGYTILLGNTSTQVLNAMVMSHLPYDPVKDFAAIGIVAKLRHIDRRESLDSSQQPKRVDCLHKSPFRQNILRFTRNGNFDFSCGRDFQATC